jgi:flagellar biosynthesis anti-sigma factor FlgM
MKIDGASLFPETGLSNITRRDTSAGSQSTSVEGESSNGTAYGVHTISRLAAQLQNVPEIRQSRVDALRRAIQSGQYDVSDQQIAGALYDQLLSGGAFEEVR